MSDKNVTKKYQSFRVLADMCIDKGWIKDSDNVDELLYNTTMVLVVKNMLLEHRLRSDRSQIWFDDIKILDDTELKSSSDRIIQIHEEFSTRREKIESDKIEIKKLPKKKIYEWVERKQPISKSVGCQTSRYNDFFSTSEDNLLIKKTNLPKVARKKINVIRMQLNNRYEPLAKIGIDEKDFESFDGSDPRPSPPKPTYKFKPKQKDETRWRTVKESLELEKKEQLEQYFKNIPEKKEKDPSTLIVKLAKTPKSRKELGHDSKVIFKNKEFSVIDDEKHQMYFVDFEDSFESIDNSIMTVVKTVFENLNKNDILEVTNHRRITVYKLKYNIYMAKDDECHVVAKIDDKDNVLRALKWLLDVTINI